MLIPRGQDSNGDVFPLFGVETLVNHGRSYYNNTKPFTVPYEYKWKPRFDLRAGDLHAAASSPR